MAVSFLTAAQRDRYGRYPDVPSRFLQRSAGRRFPVLPILGNRGE